MSWIDVCQRARQCFPLIRDAYGLGISSAVGEYNELGPVQLGNPKRGTDQKPSGRPKHQEALQNCFYPRVIREMSSNGPCVVFATA